MKTFKLIKRSWLLVFIYLFLRFIQWGYQNYATNEDLKHALEILFFSAIIAVCILLLRGTIIFIIHLSYGEYNEFFSKHSDPIIEKVEKFFNRRNIEK